MLDAVVDYLPAPIDMPAGEGQPGRQGQAPRPSVTATDDEPFSALAFKIMTDPFVGTLTFFRVYSGVLNSGDTVYNPIKGSKERIGRLLQMHANKREEIKEVCAGDIAAAVGLKDVTTGDTLCDREARRSSSSAWTSRSRSSRWPIEPKTKADQEKMGIALQKLAQEDPTFRVQTDEETGQTIISGMGELHLEIIVDRMKREFKRRGQRRQAAGRLPRDDPRAGRRPRASTSSSPAAAASTATCGSRSSRSEPGKGYEFENDIVGGSDSEGIHPGRRQGHPGSDDDGRRSPAIRWSTSRSAVSTVRTTTSTRTRWRSRSPARWRSRTAAKQGASPCCSSRS